MQESKKGFETIGYGGKELGPFIQILKRFKVTCLVDVRSYPYSKNNSTFNKPELEKVLAKEGIAYKWMGIMLGGQPKDILVYDEDGRVNYQKLVKTDLFAKGIEELEELSKKHNVVIMCCEKNPMNCHRFLAISRELSERGYKVVHITDIKTYQTQSQLEIKLFEKYFGDVGQLNFFNSLEKMTAEAYIKRNQEYGYRREKNEN